MEMHRGSAGPVGPPGSGAATAGTAAQIAGKAVNAKPATTRLNAMVTVDAVPLITDSLSERSILLAMRRGGRG